MGGTKITSITKEQLPGSPDWVDPLLQALNTVLAELNSQLNRGLSLTGNFPFTIREFVLKSTDLPLKVNTQLSSRITGAVVTYVKNIDSPATPVPGPVWADWTDNGGGKVTINTIYGLTAATKYTVRILFLTGK